MKARNPIERCKHFGGVYLGRCSAGIEYESVADRNRKEEEVRYPCEPRLGCFESCPKYERDKQWERLNRAIGSPVKIIRSGYVAKADKALLLGITIDKREVFVSITRNGNQGKTQRVGSDRVRLLVKGRKGNNIEADAKG